MVGRQQQSGSPEVALHSAEELRLPAVDEPPVAVIGQGGVLVEGVPAGDSAVRGADVTPTRVAIGDTVSVAATELVSPRPVDHEEKLRLLRVISVAGEFRVATDFVVEDAFFADGAEAEALAGRLPVA